jgi:hypothetical protein
MMPSKLDQQMNVARPTLTFRAGAWGGFLTVTVFLSYATTQLYERAGEGMRDLWPFVALLVFFLYAIVRTHEVYRWNNEEIRFRALWHESSMRWEDITQFYVRRFGGSCVLVDNRNRRLVIATFMLGEDPPLQRVLIEKLARLDEQELKELEGEVNKIDTSGEAGFPVGWRAGSYFVRGNSLVHKRGRKSREVALSDVETVYQRGLKGSQGTIIETRSGESLRIPSYTKGYRTLIAHIRAKAENAVWVNLHGPEPAESREKAAYLTGKIKMIRESRRAAKLMLSVAAAIMVMVVAQSVWKVTRYLPPLGTLTLVYTVPLQAVSLAFVSAIAIQNLRHNARKLRNLQAELAAVEAETDGGVGNE